MREFYDPFETGLFCYHKLIATVAESVVLKDHHVKKVVVVIDILKLKPLNIL